MKRKLLKISALILSVIILTVSLTGCTDILLSLLDMGGSYDPVNFDDMVYERPDMDEVYERLDSLTEMIETCSKSYKTQLSKLNAFCYDDYYNFLTMYNLAFVRFIIMPDSDKLYEEYYYMAEESADFSAKMEKLFVACAQSKYCDRFEEDCLGEGALDDYKDGAKQTEESIRLSSKEATLVAEYKNLCLDEDTTADEYAENYAELVKTRLLLAQELGYETYADYAFEMLERDYTPEQAFSYIDEIVKYILPVYRDRLSSGLMWSGENRYLSEKELRLTVSEIMDSMGSYTGDVFEIMTDCNLLYVADSEYAVTESFTTYFESYYSPFIYMSSLGTLDDIMTLVHEFGHFTDNYYNFNQNYILDLCEISSQALELLSLGYMNETSTLSKSDIEYVTDGVFDSLISTFVQQGLFTRFEELVYSLDYDDVTVENINKAARTALEEFGLENMLGSFETEWYTITHFYNQAFYVTSYITSGDVALQIYEISVESQEDGFEKYQELLSWDYALGFVENVERAGLLSPFADGRVQEIGRFFSDF